MFFPACYSQFMNGNMSYSFPLSIFTHHPSQGLNNRIIDFDLYNCIS